MNETNNIESQNMTNEAIESFLHGFSGIDEPTSIEAGINEIVDSELNETLQDNNTESSDFQLTEEEEELMNSVLEEVHNEIPKNSSTLLVDEGTSRFSSAIWYKEIQKKSIILAGIGGIGSYVGFLLSRLKPSSLFIYDPDTVETVNMSGQLFGVNDVGLSKSRALINMIRNYSNYHSVWGIEERFTDENNGCDIMICGFDNMEARKTFFNCWKDHVNSRITGAENCLFIDGRLAAEEFQVFCIKGDDTYNMEKYEKDYLFTDEQADPTICSYKQTTFMANMIGSVMVNLFTNFVANQCSPLIDRDLPFYTGYNAETMYFKTIS